jgi:CDP-diacylglycerol---glycerol-3-phosphate 3-phosphatidyltransferase
VARRTLRQELFTVPNLLTLGRILLVPVFLLYLYYESPLNSFIAAMLFILAGLTDVIDGWVARKWQLVTVLGKFLDPIADKLLVMAALVMLLALGRVPSWVVIVIISRELIISALRTLAMSEGVVIAAGQGGKWKTSLQVLGLIGLIIHYPYVVDFFFTQVDLDFNRVGLWLLYISIVPMVWSAVQYFWGFWVAVQEKEEAAANAAGASSRAEQRA